MGEFPHIFFGQSLMRADSLLEAVRRHVAGQGFELVEFQMSGPPQRPSVQVRIDRPDSRPGHGVTAEDCAVVSRALQQLLAEPGGLGENYLLQVSSPGIERPVRFPEHWRRYIGRTVVLTARGVKGHPRAVIAAVPDDSQVELDLPEAGRVRVLLQNIKEALLLEEIAPAHPGRQGRQG